MNISRHILKYINLVSIGLIFIFAVPASAVELLQAGQPSPRQGILLDVATSFRVLQIMEDYPALKEHDRLQTEKVGQLESQVARYEALDEVRQAQLELYRERAQFLEAQSAAWKTLNEATLALAKQNREAQGTWWENLTHEVGKGFIWLLGGGAIAAAIIF